MPQNLGVMVNILFSLVVVASAQSLSQEGTAADAASCVVLVRSRGWI